MGRPGLYTPCTPKIYDSPIRGRVYLQGPLSDGFESGSLSNWSSHTPL